MEKAKAILLAIFIVIEVVVFPFFSEKGFPMEKLEVQTPNYLFHVKEIAPASSPIIMQYAHRIETELESIGISCDLDIVSWPILGPRVIDREVGAYKDGGYDICFFGISLGTPTGYLGDSMQVVYSSDAIPPAGLNVMYWSDKTGNNYMNYRASESDVLIQSVATNPNLTELKQYLWEWQKIWYDAMPNIVIYNQYDVHAISSGLYGYDPIGYPLDSIRTMWGVDDVVLAAITGGDTFNTMLAPDVYDQYTAGPPMGGLIQFTPSKDLVLPTNTNRTQWMLDNFGTDEYLKVIPWIAKTVGNFSEDGLQYNITIRDDVYFHDGHRVDGWDVAFSLEANLNQKTGSCSYYRYLIPFGIDDKVNHHGNYSVIVEDKNSDGFYEHLCFNLNIFYAPLLSNILGFAILPEHILGDPINHGFDSDGNFDPSLWQVAPTDWVSHSFNTGRPTDPGGLNGPIGCGPVIFKKYDPSSGIIILQKFDGIKWDDTSKKWVTDSNLRYFEFDDAKWTNMPDHAKVIITSRDDAITGVKIGHINILDPQFDLNSIIDKLQTEPAIIPVQTPETTWQGVFMNPKFEQDGVHHLNKKGVRHAISHIIPRNEIITQLLNGLGQPAYSPIPPLSYNIISETELLDYKKTLKASDGSTRPEANAATAYDEYNREIALDWLETEGYDVSDWRGYNPPAPASWLNDQTQQWNSEVKAGFSVKYEVVELESTDGSNTWYWDNATITFTEGDVIEIKFNSDPNFTEAVGMSNPVSYNISVNIGDTQLTPEQSQLFGFFVLPLVTTDGFGQKESGIRAAERYFFNSFYLPKAAHSKEHNQYTWLLLVEDGVDLYNTGPNVPYENVVHARIVTHDFFKTLTPEDNVFNLTYQASTGFLNEMLFTNTEGGDPSTGEISTVIVDGLSKLKIVRRNTITTTITTRIVTLTPRLTSNWSVIFNLGLFIALAILRKQRKK
ncbi:MAG: ABC transporter substrate-binding protein [Candidatus Hodarchaeales archaeon]